MSVFNDILKSGVGSIAGAASEKLGIDPAQAQSLIDKIVPSDAPPAEEGAQVEAGEDQQQEAAEQDQQEADQQSEAEAEPTGLLDQASAMVGGSEGLMDKAKQLLDQDGDGNPLNDIAGMASKLFNRT